MLAPFDNAEANPMTKNKLRSTTAAISEPDSLVPDPVVWDECGVTKMTGWRWTNDKKLNFPPPIKIRNRCFRSRRLLEEWKADLLRKAIAARAGGSEAA
jgi:predicted DNA-binding transcriptional regulator AlpA